MVPWLLLLWVAVLGLITASGQAFLLASPSHHHHRLLPGPGPRLRRRLSNNGIMMAGAASFTWIRGYVIDNVDSGATTMPACKDAALLQLHPDGVSPPNPGAALTRLWRINRLDDDGEPAGMAGVVVGETDAAGAFLLGDPALLEESEACRLILKTLAPSSSPSEASIDAGTEMVSWVDNHGRDLLPPGSPGIPRLVVHRLNLLHKGAGIFVREGPGDGARVFVHQRADNKRIFPSMHDMFIGGVSLHGEATEATARR